MHSPYIHVTETDVVLVLCWWICCTFGNNIWAQRDAAACSTTTSDGAKPLIIILYVPDRSSLSLSLDRESGRLQLFHVCVCRGRCSFFMSFSLFFMCFWVLSLKSGSRWQSYTHWNKLKLSVLNASIHGLLFIMDFCSLVCLSLVVFHIFFLCAHMHTEITNIV